MEDLVGAIFALFPIYPPGFIPEMYGARIPSPNLPPASMQGAVDPMWNVSPSTTIDADGELGFPMVPIRTEDLEGIDWDGMPFRIWGLGWPAKRPLITNHLANREWILCSI